MSKGDYSSAKDVLQIIQMASDQESSELDETKLKKSRSKRHKKKYESIDDVCTLNDKNYNRVKTSKKVKRAHDTLPLKPENFQSVLKCTKTTNKSLDATKTQVNVEKKTVSNDNVFNSGSSSLILPANSDDNDNQSSSAVCQKSQLRPAVDLSRSDISKTLSSLVDATKTQVNVEKKTVSNDNEFNSGSSSLILPANSDDNDNQSSSAICQKSQLRPAVDLSHSDISKTLSSLVDFSKDIIFKVNKLIYSIEDLNKRIQIIENILNAGRNTVTNENSIIDEMDDLIPLQTVDKFYEFDDKLNNQKYLRQVAKFMKSIGGSETHELVQNILKRFMTNNLATSFNIQGKNLKKDDAQPKIAFKNTNLFKCVMKAAHLHRSNIDENNVQNKSIAPWLAQANLRLSREKIKEAKKEASQNETTPKSDNDETTSGDEEQAT